MDIEKDMSMKIEIITREAIKPSSPTPSHLRTFKLSFLDQNSPSAYTSLVLFYLKNHENNEQISPNLKRSLSETLTLFYPLAGRIVDNTTVDCTDDEARYVEARLFGATLPELLRRRGNEDDDDDRELKRLIFLPARPQSREAATSPLLIVQVTFSDGGAGVAIGVCVSHKLADAATLSTFLKTWSALFGGRRPLVDLYTAGIRFPARYGADVPPPVDGEMVISESCVAKRFVVDGTKIAEIKKVIGCRNPNPSRVEAVTAFVWKSAIVALRSDKKRFYSRHGLVQLVNLRGRVDPKISDHSTGNILGIFDVEVNDDDIGDGEPRVEDLAGKLRRGLEEYSEKLRKGDYYYGGKICANDDSKTSLFICSSWCRFGFNEVEFGFGKPIWVFVPGNAFENMITLIDTRDGDGVEVCLTLSSQNMASFESYLHDHNLLFH